MANSREVYSIFLPPSASVCFRQIPPSSVSFSAGPPLALASVSDMSVCLDDDVGGAFLATQQGVGQISGKRRIPGALMPFFFFRLPPSASAIFRTGSLLGHARVSATCQNAYLISGEPYRQPNRAWGKFRGKWPHSRATYALFCLRQHPAASASLRHLPFWVASGHCVRWRHVRMRG